MCSSPRGAPSGRPAPEREGGVKPSGSRLGSRQRTQDIARIDPETDKVVARIKLPVSPRVISIAGNEVTFSAAAPDSLP
jgi:hypothetical protein